jgi:hypothetical protein
MWPKLLQIASIISVLAGTWFLAFGLRVRSGIDSGLKKELDVEKKGLISPTDVSQRPALFWIGLALITFGALLEFFLITCT